MRSSDPNNTSAEQENSSVNTPHKTLTFPEAPRSSPPPKKFKNELSIAHSLEKIKGVYTFLSVSEEEQRNDLLARIAAAETTKNKLEAALDQYKGIKKINLTVISLYSKSINEGEASIKQKNVELATLEQDLKALIQKRNTYKDSIKHLIETELLPLTRRITQDTISQVYNILLNESKDKYIIEVVNCLVGILRNNLHTGHVIVNNYLRNHEGFLGKLVGFTGKGIAYEVAQKVEALAYAYCLEFDPNFSKNKGKKIQEKYQIFLPLAQWAKLAADLSSRQYILDQAIKEIMHKTKKIPKLIAERNELEKMAKEFTKEISTAQEAIGSVESLITAAEKEIVEVQKEISKLKKKWSENTSKTKVTVFELFKRKAKEIVGQHIGSQSKLQPVVYPCGDDDEDADII